MDVNKVKIKALPAEDFKDSDTLQAYIDELNAGGTNVVVGKLDQMINWGRANSLWPLAFATSCCGIEFMAAAAAHYDLARFGMEVTRNSPRQADLMIIPGRVSQKMAHVLRQVYDQMPNPKWVMAMGVCASSGGMFNNYAIVAGVDHIVPVDIYVPGCPPRPDMLIDAIFKLRRTVAKAPIGVHLEANEAAEESVALKAAALIEEASHV